MTYSARGTRPRKPTRTKIGQKINLLNCLMRRDGSFTDDDVARFARCYGMNEAEVRGMIAEEMRRRGEREARNGASA